MIDKMLKLEEMSNDNMDLKTFIKELIVLLDEAAYRNACYSLYILSNPGININDIDVNDLRHFVESNSEIIEQEKNVIKVQLAYNFVYRISNYIETDDRFSFIGTPNISYTGIELAIKVNDQFLRTRTIIAGGYNIQELHVRILVETSIKKKTNSLYVKEEKYLTDLKREKRNYEKDVKNLSRLEKELSNLKKDYELYSNSSLFEDIKNMKSKFLNENSSISELEKSDLFKSKLYKDIYYLSVENSVKKMMSNMPFNYHLFDCDPVKFKQSLLDAHITWHSVPGEGLDSEYNKRRVDTIEDFNRIISRFANKEEIKEKIDALEMKISSIKNLSIDSEENSPIKNLLK